MELALQGGPVEIIGARDVEVSETGITPRRLPAWTRPQIPDLFMDFMVQLSTGVRVAFRTDSPWIELDANPTGFQVTGSPRRQPTFDLVIDGERVDRRAGDWGTTLVVELVTFGLTIEPGDPVTLRYEDLGDEMRDVEIWLPPSAATELRGLRVADGARVEAPTRSARVWAHYGSSISHCIEAHGPTDVWPAAAARAGGVELAQFAFAGQCHVDQFVARSIAEAEPDLVSLKLGINVVNADSLKERTFPTAVHGFLDTLRERLPEVPVVVISPIVCPMAEDHPGPTVPDGAGGYHVIDGPTELRATSLSLTRIRELLAGIVETRRAGGDVNLFYLDGLDLFGADEGPTLPDGLHPDGDGYLRIAGRFADRVFGPGGAFAG